MERNQSVLCILKLMAGCFQEIAPRTPSRVVLLKSIPVVLMKQAKVFLYKLLGLLFFGLGALGIALPLLPTVPLWIVAAVFFASSSPSLQQKIYTHPRFGEVIRQFVENGTLSRRSKLVSIGGACFGSILGLFIFCPPKIIIVLVLSLISGTVYWIARRPEGTSLK